MKKNYVNFSGSVNVLVFRKILLMNNFSNFLLIVCAFFCADRKTFEIIFLFFCFFFVHLAKREKAFFFVTSNYRKSLFQYFFLQHLTFFSISYDFMFF